ncbi:MAG: deoxyribodipyrimidine photo-lyase, partial [Flavobacteriaceae bacterium]
MNDSNALVVLNECLRIQDNPLLELASKHSGVQAVYIFDHKPIALFNESFLPKAYFARKFELECLADTQEALHALGINLQMCENETESLAQLITENRISTIYSSLLSTTYERNLKRKLMERFEPNALKWIEKPLAYLIKPQNAPFSIEALPEVFTVFRKKIEARHPIDKPSKAIEKMEHNSLFTAHKTLLPSLAELGYTDQISDERTAHPFVGGERAAHERVNDYFFK